MAQLSIDGSRLVRFLSDLDLAAGELFDQAFAERISQLIGLHKSLALSGLPLRMARLEFAPRKVSTQQVHDAFLRTHQELIEALLESFESGTGSARVRFPGARQDASDEQRENFELYVQFYQARQRQMERKLQQLLSYVRDAASGLSPRLAQLVLLETTLAEAISGYDRQSLAVIPKLLQPHFEQLRQRSDEQQEQGPPHSWVEQFAADMAQLLLTELELRLLPIIGLIEAFDETD